MIQAAALCFGRLASVQRSPSEALCLNIFQLWLYLDTWIPGGGLKGEDTLISHLWLPLTSLIFAFQKAFQALTAAATALNSSHRYQNFSAPQQNLDSKPCFTPNHFLHPKLLSSYLAMELKNSSLMRSCFHTIAGQPLFAAKGNGIALHIRCNTHTYRCRWKCVCVCARMCQCPLAVLPYNCHHAIRPRATFRQETPLAKSHVLKNVISHFKWHIPGHFCTTPHCSARESGPFSLFSVLFALHRLVGAVVGL